MSKKTNPTKKDGTCFEGASLAELMLRIKDEEGLGCLSDDWMRSVLEACGVAEGKPLRAGTRDDRDSEG